MLDSFVVRVVFRDRVFRLVRLFFREDFRNKLVLGFLLEELLLKEFRMKLVISCFLMCVCFSFFLEGFVVCWFWGLVGEDRLLVFGIFSFFVFVVLVGEVLLEERGFFGGFWFEGSWDIFC